VTVKPIKTRKLLAKPEKGKVFLTIPSLKNFVDNSAASSTRHARTLLPSISIH
jgi:hypothetical protein